MVMFWVLAVVLCAGVVVALASVKHTDTSVRDNRGAGALAIYKDQLAELDHEVSAGVLQVDEAEGQRTEISRRLLTASREVPPTPPAARPFSRLLLLLIPALAAVVYAQVGSFGLPDVPRADRLAAAETSNDWEALIARVEQQMEKNPDDVEGWQLLVPNYLNMGRFGDAARAMGQIARIKGPSAELYANMAEAFVFENKGLMTAQSVAIVQAALKIDAKEPKALYYAALGLAQEGKTADARVAFQNLLALSPPTAPWRKTVEQEIAKLAPNAAAPQISTEQMQGAAGLAPQDRMAMIRSMVDGLDEKLQSNPNDIEGWLRLIRARTVLKEDDKAASALSTARITFATKPDQLKFLDELAKELNLK